MDSPITIRAGRRALEHIRRDGLSAADVAVVPAAAGGPKGLILNGLDRYLFGEWLPSAPRRRTLIGASIGAWRLAAAVQPSPRDALAELARLYAGQRYPRNPSARYVSSVVGGMLAELFGDRLQQTISHPEHRLVILAVRGRGALDCPRGRRREILGFALASLVNAASRKHLAGWLERVVFHDPRDTADWLVADFDAFATRRVALTGANLADALVASGSIPLILEAVRDIAGAPSGTYWDGGIIDYHLHLPYAGADGLTLYPHFTDHIVPGWLDKGLPWRRARGAWLDTVLLIAPSPAFIATLPNGTLPDRGDFKRYGEDHDRRNRDWRCAIGESERLAEAFARWLERPDSQDVTLFD